MWAGQWTTRALCRRIDPDTLFVPGAARNQAKVIRQNRPVRTECLIEALDDQVEFGVRGGMTERERRSLLRAHPSVTAWEPLLEVARREVEGDLSRYARAHLTT